ncbi:MAG: hypothetical protein ACREOQ_22950 [Gemmatimonadales bacterium]
MRQSAGWTLTAALLGAVGCGDGGAGPGGDTDGQRLASQFERLADSVAGGGFSPTADALRHAAEIVRLTGHATPVSVTLDGEGRSFLAVAEQLDFPDLQCSWPSDSGVAPPGDTIVVQPGGSGGGTPPTAGAPPDTVPNPPVPGPPGQCTQVGVFSMRTLIAWEPDRMAEVVRVVADVGSSAVDTTVPDVMTGLPTNAGAGGPSPPDSAPAPGDTVGGGGGGSSAGFPGFMGEYLVRDVGSWFAVEGSQTNTLEASGGACTSDRATFDWAEFSCEAARFRFEFTMRVEPLRIMGPPVPVPGATPPPDQPEGDHTLAMAATSVDGVRLSVIAWTPPPLPSPGPLPPDSTVVGR